LAAHRLIASRLSADPSSVLRARSRLERWNLAGRIHPRWHEQWSAALGLPLPELADLLSDPANADLRQTSPFAGELDARERWAIWRSVA
jgi:hypothetical protein